MPLTDGMTLRTVVGEVRGLPDGVTATVTFKKDFWQVGVAEQAAVRPYSYKVVTTTDGTFSQVLPVTDDSAWSNNGPYEVKIQYGTEVVYGSMELPAAAVSPVNWASYLQLNVPVGSPTVTYLTLAMLGVTVASLVNGKVPASQLPASSGGSAVDSVAGRTGDVVLVIADITDTTVTGRAVATAANAAAARTAIGAGTSSLALGTTAGTAAAGDDSRITGAAQKSANLSDLANAGTARTNLGLGNSATRAVGTTSADVAAGDAPASAASSAVSTHVGLADPHTQYSRIFVWNGSAYVASTTADIYIGPGDPGVIDGIWIDSDA